MIKIFRKPKDGDVVPEAPKAPKPKPRTTHAIVIGGGHNGLICASYLANAGWKVMVLEANERPGGMLANETIEGRFQSPLGAHYVTGLHARVVRDLKLHKFGVKFSKLDMDLTALDGDGHGVRVSLDPDRRARPLLNVSDQDVEAYPIFMDKLARYSEALASLADHIPPIPTQRDTSAWSFWLRQVADLNDTELRELMRWSVASVGDILDEYFESDLLKACLAFDGINGGTLGTRAMGTMFTLMWQHGLRSLSTEPMAVPRGGMSALAKALFEAAKAKGVVVRTNARVASVKIDKGQACGVCLDNGEEIKADFVVSSLDPKTTMLDMVGKKNFDTDHVRHTKRLNNKGNVARVILALDGMPFFTGLGNEDWTERVLICPNVDYADRAARALKYNTMPHELVIELVMPSVADPTIAPAEHHIVSANVHFIPYEPNEGWDACKEELAERVVDTLGYVAPNLRGLMVGGDLLTPPEVEAACGSPGGHWHHVDWTLDHSTVLRTFPGIEPYHTPVPRLFLCGAGTHAGGGITGIAGMNAAKQIISAELKTAAEA